MGSGAYLVESNQGRLNSFPAEDWTVSGYRTSVAVAKYSRVVAAEMYGGHRPFGYVFGGSGGAYKTISSFENAPGVWEGTLPSFTRHRQTFPVPSRRKILRSAYWARSLRGSWMRWSRGVVATCL